MRFKGIKRGHYHFESTLLTENGGNTERGEITGLYRDELEKSIKLDEPNYLWSHRRFKFEWEKGYGEIIK